MREIGYQNGVLAGWSALSFDAHETNPDLEWPESINIFDKMRREDAQVESVLLAVTLPIRRAEWSIDPAQVDPEVAQFIADELNLPIKGQTFVPPLRQKDRFSWVDHLRLALLELVFGHSFFEQVYRVDGDRAHLRKLAWRAPRSISNINVAADGGLVSIQQHSIPGRQDIVIPVDRLVAYVNGREGADWLGTSLLRPAYKNWLLKDRFLRIQALTAERNGLGIPVYTGAGAPEGISDEEKARAWNDEQKKTGIDVARSLRAGQTAGASIPPGSKLELMGVTGTLPGTAEPIQYHDEQIARAVLAHFLNLGTQTGSWALGTTFADFFTGTLNAVAQHICDVTQQHVVEDLVDVNWGADVRCPRLSFEPIGSEHPATADAIASLIKCGAIEPDDDLEQYMRERYGLPVKDSATTRPLPATVGSPKEAPQPSPDSGEDEPSGWERVYG